MKFFYIIVIFPIFIFSQNMGRDTMNYVTYYDKACEEQNRKDKTEYNKLKKEASDIDFDLLTKTLIDDLDEREFTRKYINFRYNVFKLECGVIGDYECVSEYNLKDPFYNLKSWTPNDLIYLGKKFKNKFIIPSAIGGGFGSYEGYLYTDEEDSQKFKKFYKGKVKETGAEFYYYSTNNREPLEISNNTGMDYIRFSFTNLLDYRVMVQQFVNKKKSVKIYRYDNGKWIFEE